MLIIENGDGEVHSKMVGMVVATWCNKCDAVVEWSEVWCGVVRGMPIVTGDPRAVKGR